MKIDAMVRREDFYRINEETLQRYFAMRGTPLKITTVKRSRRAMAYVYEKLNAIIAKRPSQDVRDFIETEYTVKGSMIRRLLVKLYIFAVFHTGGLLADRVLVADADMDMTNILIYPCNKKIRVFDFDKAIVDVVTKHDYPNDCIRNEIAFRRRSHGEHVEPILTSGENRYRERIIAGKPLARLDDLDKYETLKKESLDILRGIAEETKHIYDSKSYINEVVHDIESKADVLLMDEPLCRAKLRLSINSIRNQLSTFDEDIELTLSHGDFHHGNIWVENGSDRIVIIDWESHDIRSEWYDVFTLCGWLREVDGAKKLINMVWSGTNIDFVEYRDWFHLKAMTLIVILEDILFRIMELESLSVAIGISDFEHYCSNLCDALSKVF